MKVPSLEEAECAIRDMINEDKAKARREAREEKKRTAVADAFRKAGSLFIMEGVEPREAAAVARRAYKRYVGE